MATTPSDEHFDLTVRVTGGVIEGELRDDVGESTRFQGWLGLLAALDQALPPRGGDRSHPR